ncbi:ATP-binding protein [Paenibacillus agricola]|uniref:histidine kinase n=1 Tax=Paenibacillus agricola TaxID=2716264 RepID=A0ABX0JB59_9BACL|nr:ATP-binding protein [Paenibacillus agricola]NHN32008.1 response regulator [Paenibacillus agricola]
MNLTRSKVSIIYVIIIVTLLAFISISSYLASTNMEREMNSVVTEAFPLAVVAGNLIEDLVNQESGVRGFGVTRDERYLEIYEQGKLQLSKDLNTLAMYQKKHASLKSLMEDDLLPQIERLQNFNSTQIELVRAGKSDEALARSNSGKVMMDRFRQLHLKLRTEIDTIATEAYADAMEAGRSARIIISVGGALALVVGLFSAIIFNRANRAETSLRKSEETYRYMAESLEVQNEEIIAQQEEQEQTLEMLSQRELELEAISTYQEKLTGALEMSEFLAASIPSLLQSLKLDAALLVVKESALPIAHSESSESYRILYATGYPQELPPSVKTAIFGPALRVFTEKAPIECQRDLSDAERGFHQATGSALDQYYPLFDDSQNVIGFLLLSGYILTRNEAKIRLARGLAKQFGLAFHAQLMNEDRRNQSIRLSQLNDLLLNEKIHIEGQRDLIENILESTHEGMVLVDAKGFIQFANHRMHDFLKIDKFIGKSWTELGLKIKQTNPSLVQTRLNIEGLFQGSLNTTTERFEFADPEGLQRFVELYATKVGGKETQLEQGYLFVFRDRTEEEKVDVMKNEFISIVSHELRTPLASVLGFVEILLYRKLAPDKQEKYLQTIYKEAIRLSTLINDFLDLQRMESGKETYHFAPLNLASLVLEVADQWKGEQSHHIQLHASNKEIWVRGDSDRFKQIIHNLLSNAFKYSPQANQVDVTIDIIDDQVQLRVQDYGLGIPEDAKDKLFTKFYRVDNSDRRQIGGTGLGLAIVKEIIDAHNGSITFTSEMGVGTTFTVGLGIYQVPHVDGSIIILEDDDNLAKLIQVALSTLDIPIVHLRSAEEGILALHRIQSLAPRLCIVDIHLEGIKNGWDFMAELYQHSDFCNTPVIVSTALEAPLNYHEKDIEKYMRKPFSMKKLVQVVENLLNNKQSHTSYVFPMQDEALIKTSLERNGIQVSGITHDQDVMLFELKSNTGADSKKP